MVWYNESKQNDPLQNEPKDILVILGICSFFIGLSWLFMSVLIPVRLNFIAGCTAEEVISVINIMHAMPGLVLISIGILLLLKATSHWRN